MTHALFALIFGSFITAATATDAGGGVLASFVIFGVGIVVGIICVLAADWRVRNNRGRHE